MSGELLSYTITDELQGERLDKGITVLEDGISRSYIKKLLDEGRVLVNGKPQKPSCKLKQGDILTIDMPEPETLEVLPEHIPLDIVHEDTDIVIVNKPKGLVVHPAPGHSGGTLVNALMYHCGDSLSGINGVLRPGIVHRIDKDTSGLLVICKNDRSHRCIAQQLKEHSIKREYRCIVKGNLPEQEGTVINYLGRDRRDRKKMAVVSQGTAPYSEGCTAGKRAVTHYRVLESFQGYDYVSCRLETGRTHQIRVHMAGMGHSVLGDEVYGKESDRILAGIYNKYSAGAGHPLEGQVLHAKSLGFIHPGNGKLVEFDSELPDYFLALLERLRSG